MFDRRAVLALLAGVLTACASEPAPEEKPEPPPPDIAPFPVRFPPLSVHARGLETRAKDGGFFREEKDGVRLALLSYATSSQMRGSSYHVKVENTGADPVRVDFGDFRLQPQFDPRWLRPTIVDARGPIQELLPGESTTRRLDFNVWWSEPRGAVLSAAGVSRGRPPRPVPFEIVLDAL